LYKLCLEENIIALLNTSESQNSLLTVIIYYPVMIMITE